tara:strand:+ start:677 stop:1366 length:690 start_codon:yes stop_codon:yes gene_type:complete
MEIKTALILCAGYGKRLNPLTLDTPKPLIKLNNITLLENTINLISSLGIQKIKINTFYLKEKIKSFLDNFQSDIKIEIIDDGKDILDTGGGILNMVKNSDEENYIIFNHDTIWDKNYIKPIEKMEQIYFEKNIKNILLVVNKKLSFDKKLKGDFILNNNILEKNIKNEFIFTGAQIISKSLFSVVKSNKFSINKIWDKLLDNKNLYGHEFKDKFYHVTDLEIYNSLIKN